MECLLSSAEYCWNRKRSLASIFLGDIDAPQRFGFIPTPIEVTYGLHLLLWCFPDQFINPGGLTTSVLSDPSYGQGFGRKRVGEGPLEGFHLSIGGLSPFHGLPPFLPSQYVFEAERQGRETSSKEGCPMHLLGRHQILYVLSFAFLHYFGSSSFLR